MVDAVSDFGTTSQGNYGRVSSASVLEKTRAVGVALQNGSKPIKLQANSPSELLPIVQKSIVTWINYGVKDLEKDGIQVASEFGFSEPLIPPS